MRISAPPGAVSRIGTLAVLAVLGLAAAGCTAGPAPAPISAPSATVPPAGSVESHELVQNYLDAMRAKDVDQGRAQLCAATQEIFDASATGPNGDFAESFSVSRAEVTGSRRVAVGHEVTATVAITSGAGSTAVDLVFTVTPADFDAGDWCIHDETAAPAGGPSATPPV
ncbi:hypothetical protein ACN27F_29585 [Solwaraspora sp. WMMB335]|uniref:hypothetical protein n=1 Tax=Solwaraspora sp. WMMB335 TaxID=3404118 RepID=UPI003B93A87C